MSDPLQPWKDTTAIERMIRHKATHRELTSGAPAADQAEGWVQRLKAAEVQRDVAGMTVLVLIETASRSTLNGIRALDPCIGVAIDRYLQEAATWKRTQEQRP